MCALFMLVLAAITVQSNECDDITYFATALEARQLIASQSRYRLQLSIAEVHVLMCTTGLVGERSSCSHKPKDL